MAFSVYAIWGEPEVQLADQARRAGELKVYITRRYTENLYLFGMTETNFIFVPTLPKLSVYRQGYEKMSAGTVPSTRGQEVLCCNKSRVQSVYSNTINLHTFAICYY